MARTVTFLENALQAWEDSFLLSEARIRTGIITGTRRPEEFVGPVRHWRVFRNHLRSLKGEVFDVGRVCHRAAGLGLTTGVVRELCAAELGNMLDGADQLS